jgi:IclR helix-turn-helix domain
VIGDDRGAERDQAAGRRLTLTSIGFDVILALSQDPSGIRLSPLAAAIGSPVSSVQAALRILLANGLVERDSAAPPSYRLAGHPARDEVTALAIVLPDPAHALGVVLRANPAVTFAAADRNGFIAATDDASAAARDLLAATVERIHAARPSAPPVETTEREALARLLTVSLGLDARLRDMVVLKGRVPRERATKPATERTPDRIVI